VPRDGDEKRIEASLVYVWQIWLLLEAEVMASDRYYATLKARAENGCSTCRDHLSAIDAGKEFFAPSHEGSSSCESGSIASGGRHSHCTCDTCF